VSGEIWDPVSISNRLSQLAAGLLSSIKSFLSRSMKEGCQVESDGVQEGGDRLANLFHRQLGRATDLGVERIPLTQLRLSS
jgi:hypothetical protein